MSDKEVWYFSLSTHSSVGGIQNYNKTFLKSLYSFDKRSIKHISVYDDSSNSTKGFSGNKYKFILYFMRSLLTIKNRVYIFSHVNFMPLLIIVKFLFPKANVYLSIYGVEVWKEFNYIYKFFFRRIKIFYISNYTKDKFCFDNDLNSEFNFIYLPPAVNIENSSIENSSIENKTDGIVNILCLTRLDKEDSYKGVDILIDSIHELKLDNPELYSILKVDIVGKGDDKERLVNYTKLKKVDAAIKFYGYVPSIESFYINCDIFVLPSNGEGFGIVYIEAMLKGKPVIGCCIGGQTDIIDHGVNGLLVNYADIQSLKEAIVILIKSKNTRDKYGRNGYEKVISTFSEHSYKERLEKELERTG